MQLISVVQKKKKKKIKHEIGYSADEGPLVLPCLYHHIDDKITKFDPNIYRGCLKEAKRLCYADNSVWSEDVEQHDRDSDSRIILSCIYRKTLGTQEIRPECAYEVMRVRAKSIDLMPEIQEHWVADINGSVDYKLKEKR
jgi:hypothetical protein